MSVLVTGAAGFIGFHVSKALLEKGVRVRGVDNMTPYYDVVLKQARLDELTKYEGFGFRKLDLADRKPVEELFANSDFTRVVHLAAQAGVRYAFENAHAYVDSNLTGFLNVLEGCRHKKIEHLVFASSSSVYGANTKMPFSVHHNVDHPVSFYAATKKANELMAHSYSHLFRLPVTGLRFFTAYGPWGRPDMSLFLFTSKILAGEEIEVFNYGNHARDFTYIDDVVEGVLRVLDRVPEPDQEWSGEYPDPATSSAPYRIYNIGNNQPVELIRYIECIEAAVGKKASMKFLPLQPGDVPRSFADIDALAADVGFRPSTPIEVGIDRFVKWYREYYKT